MDPLTLTALAIAAATLGIALGTSGDARKQVLNIITNLTRGVIDAAIPVLTQLEGSIGAVVDAFKAGLKTHGPALVADLKGPFGNLAREGLDTVIGSLAGKGIEAPDSFLDKAGDAMGDAFGFGLASFAAAAAFESVFPKSLNVLDGVAPMLATMAGFEEVTKNALGPALHVAIGVPAEASANKQFRPRIPALADALTLRARRLIDDATLAKLVAWAGLHPDYVEAMAADAYRPVPPFLLARAAEAGALPQDQLTETLQFAGFRDIDIARLEAAYAALALQPYERVYLSTAERAVELGYESPLHLQNVMNTLNLNAEMQNLVQLTVAERRADNLTVLYKKSISEAYKYGQVSDANYVPSLEAVGIDSAEANALYSVDSIAKSGKAAIAAQRAEARLAAQQTRAAMQAAIAEFRTGTIDAVGLEAALIVAGVDPQIASFAVIVQEARKSGPKVFVYGQELTRGAALQLREKVAALAKQSTAKLITYEQALAQLHALGIPDANALALTAAWFATTTTPARVGVREPI